MSMKPETQAKLYELLTFLNEPNIHRAGQNGGLTRAL
jgi:hypothetical protein